MQIDFLHETNRALERRLHDLTELKRNLSEKQFDERLRNDDLLRDLKDIDRLARKVQADKDYTVDAADRELHEAKVNNDDDDDDMPSSTDSFRLKFNRITEKYKRWRRNSPV